MQNFPEIEELIRYIDMVKDMKSYREYTVEMENIQAEMNTHGKTTKIRWQLQNKFDAYWVARETYLEKMLAKYQVGSLEAIQHEMRATEPLIERAYHQTPHSPERPTTLERAYTAMQEEQKTQPQQPQKKALRDLYTTSEEEPSRDLSQQREREEPYRSQ
jgi:ADP-heptose:LPS heptosyltransferase